MKKILFVGLFLGFFILGLMVSEPLMNMVNHIFAKDVFQTRKNLEEKWTRCRQRYEALVARLKKKQENLADFAKEIKAKDYFTLTKESLLSSTPSSDSSMGKIMLRPPSSEMLFKPTTADDSSIREVKEGLNEKIKTMMNVSKGILREKLAQLNVEIMDINTKLRGRNLELNQKLDEVETYKQEVEKHKKYIQELEGIRTDLKKVVSDLETKIENGRLKVSFEGDILFDSGSHQLKESGLKLLESVFPVLKKSTAKNDIFIAGHTDNVPIKKEFQHKYHSNWDLSTYRAIEVVRYLTAKGLNPTTLTAAGYGEYKPISDNISETGKAKNRRVELFVIPRLIQRKL
ncbi:MAG: OmpA family protein [Candidatus Aminicenantes bacterium]|nr:OmpA family protein [Candidatus Aminicenantes bacterium]